MNAPTRQRLDVVLDDASLGGPVQIGTLYRDQHRAHDVISFEYTATYLARHDAIAIDPQLPLLPGPTYPKAEQTLFGVFRDTAPDRWGRLLMDRREAMEADEDARPLRHLSEWDYLTGVSDATRMGALRLRRPDPPKSFIDDRERAAPPATRLRELEAIARALTGHDAERNPAYHHWLSQLVAPGTSLGGARPKATFMGEQNDLWLAKFPSHDDRRDVGAWEYLAWQLSQLAGIQVPEAKLLFFGDRHHTFAARRFDRADGSRRLYASAMTLLGRHDGDGGSYLDLSRAIQTYGDPAGIADDLAELYRRAAFSIVIGNRDDHLRNHGFVRTPGGWRLAPAFDINPNPDKRTHALAINANDPTPSIEHLHATHRLYRLSEQDARAIETAVREAAATWRKLATSLKLGKLAMQQLGAIIDTQRP